ncbi:MAG TPA: guanylate kinase [Flavilitoribacter sp.]|nr:guanylate kinase [Lewinella sp.]MCB9282032.1 guanylate kinase [Lewinellaceae bacterium]HMQ60315.1 guanylate kinase [Flavilitoribacter sp.]HMQ88066.1 guanylate kinase [Flavilitoribacter sp.]
MGKLIIFTAPSGAGKTTIVRHLLKVFPNLAFSVSATTRQPRSYEEEGRDYYFVSVSQFRSWIDAGAFAEWQEVYEGQFYGTLHSEISRLWAEGKHIIFDIDVKGAVNLKKTYGDQALSVFVKPPSPEVLFERLNLRRTEDPVSLAKRIAKTKEELSYQNKFDAILVNDVLETALTDAERLVSVFLGIGAKKNLENNP